MKSVLWLMALVWLATLGASALAVRCALQRTAASVRKALKLALFALVVAGIGWLNVGVAYRETSTSTDIKADGTKVVRTSEKKFDSRWFFAFSAGVAAIALAVVIRERKRLADAMKHPSSTPAV